MINMISELIFFYSSLNWKKRLCGELIQRYKKISSLKAVYKIDNKIRLLENKLK